MQSKLILFLCVLILSKTFDMCGDGSIYFDTMHCCKAEGETYTCCLNSYTCCSSGDYCCNELNEYNKIFKVKSVSSYKIEIPEYISLIDAALNQLDFYDYFPYVTSCGKDAYPLVPLFIEIIEDIKKIEKAEDVIPVILKIVTQLYPQLYDLLNEKCKEVPKEVEEKVKILYDIVTSDEYLQKLVVNLKNRFQEIFIQINSFQQQLEYGNYKQAGKNIGTAIAIALMID